MASPSLMKTPARLTTTTLSEKLAFLRYNLLLFVALLPVFCITVFQAVKHKDGRYLLQRFGLGYPRQPGKGLWIHAASVGEVQALLPLIAHLQKLYPNLAIRLSTVTPTGGKIARQKIPNVSHVYLPLDLPALVKSFVYSINASCGLIMETELWPHLYRAAELNNICLITINGRISPKTMTTRTWIRQLYSLTLQKLTAVLAKSELDAERFLELGSNAASTRIVGNLKFAIAADFVPPSKPLNIQRPFVLAASTHPGEEQLIAGAWKQADRGDYLLVIAPRHPYRSAAIVSQLTAFFDHIAVRSKGDEVTPSTQVYLADTLGELMDFMRDADWVFMGGSLVAVGGHNILEPAMLGKAIVFGPFMHNFSDEARLFLHHHAAVQVQDEQQLQTQIQLLLHDAGKRSAYGERAMLLMRRDKDMVQRYVTQINHYCKLNDLDH